MDASKLKAFCDKSKKSPDAKDSLLELAGGNQAQRAGEMCGTSGRDTSPRSNELTDAELFAVTGGRCTCAAGAAGFAAEREDNSDIESLAFSGVPDGDEPLNARSRKVKFPRGPGID